MFVLYRYKFTTDRDVVHLREHAHQEVLCRAKIVVD